MKPEELQKLYAAGPDACREIEEPESSARFKMVGELMREYRESRKVLDVGCATGSLLRPYAGFHDITGVDIVESLLAEAARTGYRKVLPLDVSTQPLPFPEKSFDVVFCGECLEHVVDTDWVLCEINRVLKPGGHFILTFPNIRTPMSILMMLLNLPPMFSARYRSAHVRDFTTGTIRLALRNCGFREDLMWGIDFYFVKIGRCLSGLARPLPSWAAQAIVRSVKEKDVAYSADEVAKHEIFKSSTG
jgi:SAM-dependent methyltransferase